MRQSCDSVTKGARILQPVGRSRDPVVYGFVVLVMRFPFVRVFGGTDFDFVGIFVLFWPLILPTVTVAACASSLPRSWICRRTTLANHRDSESSAFSVFGMARASGVQWLLVSLLNLVVQFDVWIFQSLTLTIQLFTSNDSCWPA